MKSAREALPRRRPRSRAARATARTACSRSRTRRRSPRARASSRRAHSAHGEADVVDVRAVRVVELRRPSSSSSSASDPTQCAWPCLAAPDRQRRAPVALARERPVDVAAQPVAEAPVLDVRRVPVDLRRCSASRRSRSVRGRDVPGRLGVVEQRRAAAPAVRVGVLVLLGAQQPAARAQVLDEVRVGVLDEAPGVRRRCARRRCRRGARG